MTVTIGRRELLAALGSAVAAWPLAARAQQVERTRRIGVLTYIPADDAEGQARLAAFTQALRQLGWSEGRNLRIESRWANAGDVNRHAAELVALAPDVLLAATGTATVAPLLQATKTIPIVFVNVIDPIGSGFVASLAHPGGNATGFTIYEFSMSGKWLELLKEIAPGVTRAAVLRDPASASGTGQFGAVQIVAPALGVQVTPVDVRDAGEIERAVAAFARGPNGGLIVTGSALGIVHRELIAQVAARHKLPAVFPGRFYVTSGGLISYGPDLVDQFWRAAGYVDRILKGARPADLPVQAPTSTSSWSTSRPRRRSASKFRHQCSRAPTRWSNETPRVHRSARRRGGAIADLAAHAARAADGGAGDRVPQQQLA